LVKNEFFPKFDDTEWLNSLSTFENWWKTKKLLAVKVLKGFVSRWHC
jgi:hypothetical protein